jgi:hypothetical protein
LRFPAADAGKFNNSATCNFRLRAQQLSHKKHQPDKAIKTVGATCFVCASENTHSHSHSRLSKSLNYQKVNNTRREQQQHSSSTQGKSVLTLRPLEEPISRKTFSCVCSMYREYLWSRSLSFSFR